MAICSLSKRLRKAPDVRSHCRPKHLLLRVPLQGTYLHDILCPSGHKGLAADPLRALLEGHGIVHYAGHVRHHQIARHQHFDLEWCWDEDFSEPQLFRAPPLNSALIFCFRPVRMQDCQVEWCHHQSIKDTAAPITTTTDHI